jgi:phosphopantetheinyl transferase (holo-ACP synthase)
VSNACAVTAPTEGVNDETVTVVRWLVENGSRVPEGAPLVLLETTKTAFDVPAPIDGVVWQVATVDTDVPIGGVLCYLGRDLEQAQAAARLDRDAPREQVIAPAAVAAPSIDVSPVATVAAVPAEPPVATAARGPRLSRNASALISTLGVDPSVFAGRLLVRENDVRAANGAGDPGVPAATVDSVGGLSVGVNIEMVENMPEESDFWRSDFYRARFTGDEIAYCVRQEQPRVHFAARWCAKEALRKCDPAFVAVSATALQIGRDGNGRPTLEWIRGESTQRLPHAVSLSHTGLMAAAIVAAAQAGAVRS